MENIANALIDMDYKKIINVNDVKKIINRKAIEMTHKKDIAFDFPLTEGIIQKRTSIYTMLVDIAGTMIACHCPTTGRIGKIDVSGRPCLLSKAIDPKRKTPYTVEAISLNCHEDTDKIWIGINQNAVNRYVEHYLLNSAFF